MVLMWFSGTFDYFHLKTYIAWWFLLYRVKEVNLSRVIPISLFFFKFVNWWAKKLCEKLSAPKNVYIYCLLFLLLIIHYY